MLALKSSEDLRHERLQDMALAMRVARHADKQEFLHFLVPAKKQEPRKVSVAAIKAMAKASKERRKK